MKIKIDLTEVRPKTCAKCGRPKSLFRHHMGNDKWLANFNKRIYRDYYKYYDIVYICNKCHMKIHFIYMSTCYEWSDFSEAGAWKLRAKLIGICKMWLAGQVPEPKIPRIFKDQWQTSFLAWQRSRGRKKATKGK